MPSSPTIIGIPKRNIDATATGAVLIGQVETGTQSFIPLYTTYLLTGLSGFTSAGTVSVGTNSPGYNNIRSNFNLALAGGTGFSTLGEYVTDYVGTEIYNPAGTEIYLNITVPFVATTAVLSVTVWGYYE